jgi:hypothetical protein
MTDIINASFKKKWNNYREHTGESADWLECNLSRLKELYSNVRLRDFVFEPIKGVFVYKGEDPATTIRQTITMVAVANAVMAGLPGKMGVGVAVSMALEGWMAYVIATKVRFKLKSVADVWTYSHLHFTRRHSEVPDPIRPTSMYRSSMWIAIPPPRGRSSWRW